MEVEVWRPVKVWKKGVLYDYTTKYEVSNLGRIKRLEGVYYCGHNKQQVNIVKGGIMSPSKNHKGYFIIRLSDDGIRKTFSVSRIVWESFNGQIPPGIQVNHINEIKTDNRLENLNLMTPKENCNWGTHNQRISVSNKGHTTSEETKHKISEANSGSKNGMYGKKPWNKGKKGFVPWNKDRKGCFSAETRIKMSEAAKNRWSQRT